MVHRPIRIWRTQWWCSLFSFFFFQPKIPFLGKINPKNQNCQFKLKFGIDYFEYAEFSGDVVFFCFPLKILFVGKVDTKTQNDQFKLKFNTSTDSNMQNSVQCSLFLFSTGNTLFGQFGPKIKIANLNKIWYLAKFEYAECMGDIHFFRLWSKIPFLGKFGPVIFYLKLFTRIKHDLIICRDMPEMCWKKLLVKNF